MYVFCAATARSEVTPPPRRARSFGADGAQVEAAIAESARSARLRTPNARFLSLLMVLLPHVIALLLLVLGERLPQLLDGDRLLFRGQDDLPREHHRHGAGRLAQEILERAAEPSLHVVDRDRQVG